MSCESFNQQADHGELDHGLGLTRVDLVVTVQSSAIGQPSEGAFDDPAFGQHNELTGLVALDDFDDPAEHALCPLDELAGVAAIDVDFLEMADDAKQTNQYGTCAGTILDAGRMDDDRKDETERIYRDMLLAPFGFLARVETALPPFEALLTERESMMATVGLAFRPAFCRAASRSARMAMSHVPSRRQRRRYPYTVFHGGKSFGSMRHWQPVLSTYSMPLISARKSCLGGRPLLGITGNGFTTCDFRTAHCSSVRSVGYIASSLSVVDVPHLSEPLTIF